jgi:hypothetical protein
MRLDIGRMIRLEGMNDKPFGGCEYARMKARGAKDGRTCAPPEQPGETPEQDGHCDASMALEIYRRIRYTAHHGYWIANHRNHGG